MKGDGMHPASHYLVVEDSEKPSTWHLRVRDVSGKPDRRLMGAAWAALHGGYRGNRYEGPGKAAAISKLKALYAGEGLETPDSRGMGAVMSGRGGRGGPIRDDGVERRDLLIEDVELRVDGETGAPTVEGYAAVFNSPSEVLFEWDAGKFREKVLPGAFAKTLREQNIPLLVEHGQLPLATTGSGTLELAEDGHGLRFRSVLDGSDPDVQRLAPKMRRGDMNKCSFGFIPIRETWDEKVRPRMRSLHEVRLVDVSIVARPAYPATEATVRKILAEDGLDAECIAELLVRLRMGLPLEDEDVTLMRRLAVTIGKFLPDESDGSDTSDAKRVDHGATAAGDGPGQGDCKGAPQQVHLGERAQPAMQASGPDMIVHPMHWYREQLQRMGV